MQGRGCGGAAGGNCVQQERRAGSRGPSAPAPPYHAAVGGARAAPGRPERARSLGAASSPARATPAGTAPRRSWRRRALAGHSVAVTRYEAREERGEWAFFSAGCLSEMKDSSFILQ